MNKIAHDFIFTNHLSLLISSTNRSIYSLLDRFCVRILPEIHDKIKWFDLESFSMERILLAANDLNLSSLRLYNIRQETAIHLFSGKIFHFDSFNDKYIKTISFEMIS